ncbi:DNA adenine methylase [Thiothrix sp.]|uniref:DNA adenine methylase n=1 Tax=Thiothrix sp. TaxID=1032 RepID=UPI00257D42D1|nr:DNA adenine methylase [Thiothrix sp.]
MPMQQLRPPLAGYLGGKSRLAKRIIAAIPPHTCFVEVFCGAAWVLFRKPESDVEIINDFSSDVTNLYRVLQNHFEEFVKQFKFQIVSRAEWNRLNSTPPETLTDIQRAARFFYLQKMSFGGKVSGRVFGTATTARPRLNLIRLEEDLSAAHWRLAQVTVENLHYSDCIRRYDRDHSFFYLDPPYYRCENDYGKGMFSREDFNLLSGQLSRIKGKFLLSLNDTPEVREIFGGFTLETVDTSYSTGSSGPKKVTELLIRNY